MRKHGGALALSIDKGEALGELKLVEPFQLTKEGHEAVAKLWDAYRDTGFRTRTPKGDDYESKAFDQMRVDAIKHVRGLIEDFLAKKRDLKTFKSEIDGYNRRNNWWGFAAMKGQMFFNQLWNSSQGDLPKLESVLAECIRQPATLDNALEKIERLESYVDGIGRNIEDKRKAPKPSSVAYFLSYFWQIVEPDKYPIIYTSLTDTLEKLGLWREFERQAAAYGYFYSVMYAIKTALEGHAGRPLSHWDVEHCFWLERMGDIAGSPARAQKRDRVIETETTTRKQELDEGFIRGMPLRDYLPPVVADLVEAGEKKGEVGVTKGVPFEKKVAALFRMLDFEVEQLGQGKGREPDGIAKCRADNIAFIYDAKVREEGYSLGVDDRAIREYIATHFPRLERDGYKTVGFLIVSSSFNSTPDEIIDDITLQTPVKRVALVTSEALLHLLAHRLSNGVATAEIARFLMQNGVVTGDDVDEKLSDV